MWDTIFFSRFDVIVGDLADRSRWNLVDSDDNLQDMGGEPLQNSESTFHIPGLSMFESLGILEIGPTCRLRIGSLSSYSAGQMMLTCEKGKKKKAPITLSRGVFLSHM